MAKVTLSQATLKTNYGEQIHDHQRRRLMEVNQLQTSTGLFAAPFQ